MSGQKISEETEVSSTELAVVLGLTTRRIQQMAQDGTISAVSRGRFALAESVQRYIKFLAGSPMDKAERDLEKTRRTAETQIKIAKAAVAKLEAEELRGTMHRADDVAAMTDALVQYVREALLSMPGRLAVDVASAETAAEAAEIIKKEIFSVLKTLSEFRYDPKKYEERVRERRSWSGCDADEED